MNLLVERFAFGNDSTLSRLWNITGGDAGKIALAFTLEDERRETKVFAETCVPLGTYRLGLKTHGGFHERYRRRFPDFHLGMIEVLGVPNFTAILWHCGNDDDDTAGCTLIGSYPVVTPDGEFEISASVRRYRVVYPPIARAIAAGVHCDVMYAERKAAT